jgi:hypothetical protein
LGHAQKALGDVLASLGRFSSQYVTNASRYVQTPSKAVHWVSIGIVHTAVLQGGVLTHRPSPYKAKKKLFAGSGTVRRKLFETVQELPHQLSGRGKPSGTGTAREDRLKARD